MKLTEQEIEQNYQALIDVIEKYITGERKVKLLALYDELSTRLATAPASSINTFHGATPGGLVLHTLNVIHSSIEMYNLWKRMGAYMDDYTLEELVFSAINHDLGKVGDMEFDNYIPNTSEWHIKNQGKVYVGNPDIINMSVPDRGIWLLQNYGIKLSQNEFMAIKLHDGPYVEENKGYFNAWDESKRIRCNIVFVLHYADYMACRIEYEKEREERKNSVNIKPNANTFVAKANTSKLSDDNKLKDASDLFAKMFEKK